MGFFSEIQAILCDVRKNCALSFFIYLFFFFSQSLGNFASSTFSPNVATIDPLRELRRSTAAHLLRVYRRPCGSQLACAIARPRPPPRYSLALRIFGAHSASALSMRRTSWSSPGSRLLANSDFVAMGVWSALTLAQRGRPSAPGQEGGDTSSLARCH